MFCHPEYIVGQKKNIGHRPKDVPGRARQHAGRASAIHNSR